MEDNKDLAGTVRNELQELMSFITEFVQTFKRLQEPLGESGQNVPPAIIKPEKIASDTEGTSHWAIEEVESLSRTSDEIVRDITNLRKALPATYFKNRSKIRDTVSRIEEKARQNYDNASAVLQAFQFQEITSRQVDHAATLMEEIEQRLFHLLEVIDGKAGIEESKALTR